MGLSLSHMEKVQWKGGYSRSSRNRTRDPSTHVIVNRSLAKRTAGSWNPSTYGVTGDLNVSDITKESPYSVKISASGFASFCPKTRISSLDT